MLRFELAACAQTVVDVSHSQPPATTGCKAGESVEQRGGVRSAAARDEDCLTLCKHAAPVNGCGDGAAHSSDHWLSLG